MSSPATYPRCSAKSIDAPKYGARCSPLMKPSTTVRASRSRLPIRARTVGSTKRAPAIVPCSVTGMTSVSPVVHYLTRRLHAGLGHRDHRQQLVDDRIGRDAFRFRPEIREHAVAQHRMRHRPDVLEAHMVAAARQRARFGAEHQVLRRADAGA